MVLKDLPLVVLLVPLLIVVVLAAVVVELRELKRLERRESSPFCWLQEFETPFGRLIGGCLDSDEELRMYP